MAILSPFPLDEMEEEEEESKEMKLLNRTIQTCNLFLNDSGMFYLLFH